MSGTIVDIRRGQFAQDLVAVAKIHLRTTCLFTAGRRRASQLLMGAYAECLFHQEIRETAFVEAMWFLFDYASSPALPVSMDLDQWTVSEASCAYLQLLEAAGPDVYRLGEFLAISRCLEVCRKANSRFTSNGGWLPFVHDLS